MWSIPLIVVVSVLPLSPSLASILMRTGIEIPLYNQLLNHDSTFNASDVAIVDMLIDRSVFDWCHLDSFTEEAVTELLAIQGVNPKLQKWVAFFNDEFYGSVCLAGKLVVPWDKSLQLYWFNIMVSRIQRTGCIGFMRRASRNGIGKYQLLPGTAYSRSDNVYSVNGERVTIFGSYLLAKDSITLDGLVKETRGNNSTLVARAITFDTNPLDTAVTSPVSVFRLLSYTYTALSVICLVDSTILFYRVLVQSKSRSLLSFSTVTLAVTVPSNILRLVKSIDIIGVFGIYPYILSRVLLTLTPALTVTSTLSCILFWYEAIDRINSTIEFKMVKPSSVTKVFLIALSVVIIVIDITVSLLSFYGRVKGALEMVPTILYVLMLVCVGTFSIIVSHRMRTVLVRIVKAQNSFRRKKESRELGGNGSDKLGVEMDTVTKVDTTTMGGRGSIETTTDNTKTEVTRNVLSLHSNRVAPTNDPDPPAVQFTVKKGEAQAAGAVAEGEGRVASDKERVSGLMADTDNPAGKMIAKVAVKIRRALWYLTLSGVLLILAVIFILLLGTNLQYTSPLLFGLIWLVAPIIECCISICDMRILAISSDKFGTVKQG